MNKLFSCLYGSGLYGTRTPTSDRDIKHIVLPALGHLLLGKKVENKVKKTNKLENTRNGADDVDEEFIPVQVFARDFFMGQTYAIELAFAIDSHEAEQTFYYDHLSNDEVIFTRFVHELRTKFLTSNIKAMMGYVVNQASLYSFKGERLNAVRDVLAMLDRSLHPYQTDEQHVKLSEVSINPHYSAFSDEHASLKPTLSHADEMISIGFNELLKKHPKYFRYELYDIGNGEMRPCFKLLEKTLPWTSTVHHTLGVVSALKAKYGDRAAAATEHNVDWKATMHAVRIVDEGLRLLKDHKLEFPLPKDEVARLLAMKRGELPIEPIKEELSLKLDQLKELEKSTTLPSITPELTTKFEEWLEAWMFSFYNLRQE